VRVVAVVLLCVVAWTANVFAQVTTANVRGTVVSADDKAPMAGVQVTLVNEATGAFKDSVTNDVGEYAFTGLDVGGPYRVTAMLEGFKPAEAPPSRGPRRTRP